MPPRLVESAALKACAVTNFTAYSNSATTKLRATHYCYQRAGQKTDKGREEESQTATARGVLQSKLIKRESSLPPPDAERATRLRDLLEALAATSLARGKRNRKDSVVVKQRQTRSPRPAHPTIARTLETSKECEELCSLRVDRGFERL
jgi:hypothetical protein